MIEDEFVIYPSPLNKGWAKKGTWQSVSTVTGIAIYLSPMRNLNGEHPLFSSLVESFRRAEVRDFKIYSSGRVYFLAPHGMKYGFLLGSVANIYDIIEKEDDQR